METKLKELRKMEAHWEAELQRDKARYELDFQKQKDTQDLEMQKKMRKWIEPWQCLNKFKPKADESINAQSSIQQMDKQNDLQMQMMAMAKEAGALPVMAEFLNSKSQKPLMGMEPRTAKHKPQHKCINHCNISATTRMVSMPKLR